MAVYLAQIVNGVATNRFMLDKQSHTIGRRSNNDIMIDDGAISSNHAVIDAREDDYLDGHFQFFIKDLNSTNGTYVNDLEVTDERQLHNFDMIRLGNSHLFKFIDEDQDDGTGTTLDLGG